jgi:hypothetical protein
MGCMIQGRFWMDLSIRVNIVFRILLSSTNHLCLYLSSFFDISDLYAPTTICFWSSGNGTLNM